VKRQSPEVRQAFLSASQGRVLQFSLASHLVASNVNLALVKQALGHRSFGSTLIYVGTTDAQAAEAVQSALMGVI
jgi:site-specific recombinase XerC